MADPTPSDNKDFAKQRLEVMKDLLKIFCDEWQPAEEKAKNGETVFQRDSTVVESFPDGE